MPTHPLNLNSKHISMYPHFPNNLIPRSKISQNNQANPLKSLNCQEPLPPDPDPTQQKSGSEPIQASHHTKLSTKTIQKIYQDSAIPTVDQHHPKTGWLDAPSIRGPGRYNHLQDLPPANLSSSQFSPMNPCQPFSQPHLKIPVKAEIQRATCMHHPLIAGRGSPPADCLSGTGPTPNFGGAKDHLPGNLNRLLLASPKPCSPTKLGGMHKS
ncbi:hypothetical protein DSO57_1038222 [Entomophthora muscae]|uniref:Uncharacterized protein n=1 Tax=Entomophthora muscae TaxID=34485 RepID=A0ACC2SBS2_9FUNG|nr:hypothetical protein DSO57_1038222 [Entomophthora muscae]